MYKQHFSDKCRLCVRLAGTEMHRIRSHVIDKQTQITGGVVPVGYPVKDKNIMLLDESGSEVAVGEVGEITVKSRYMSPGYWCRPELTRATFQPDPESKGERIYRTGDLGRLQPDGCLEHVGRRDSQVKIRGHRVELDEVEMALLELDSVEEVAVLAREDPHGQKYLVAYIVPPKRVVPAADVLRIALAKTLPDYTIPSYFVPLRSLPLTATGKIDRNALVDPRDRRPELQVAFVPPRTPLEGELQNIWQETLGIRPVGVRDSFFNLGGDSLIAVSLCLNIEKAFHQSLPVSKFIHAPTIEKLATLLSRQDTSHTLSSVVAIQPIGSRLPLFCVPGITGSAFEFFPLSRCLSPDQPLFGLQITGLVGRETLGKIEEIAACYVHDMLLQQPKGPYCLAGYSFGCLVAYEVAQQLREMGREVGLLVFLDVPFCRAKKATLLLDVGVRRMIRRYGLRGLLVKASVEVVRKLRLLIKRSLPESVSRLGTGEALELARDAYKPKTYSGRVIFLQIRQNLDVPKIWESLITGGMEVHEVPGDHKTLLRGSSVQALAERLTECLKNLGH